MHENGTLVYATQEVPLSKQVTTLLRDSGASPVEFDVQALIVPDTNLLSGGSVAADVYASLPDRSVYENVLVVAPSHDEEEFRRISICNLDTYHSPLGDVRVDDRVRNELCDEDDDIFVDNRGHFQHTGMDVQLPFLQSVLDDFSVVPLVMGHESPEFCQELGHAVGEMMFNRPTLVIASVDIVRATEKGLREFEAALRKMDVDRLTVLLNREDDIRVRGKGALIVALIASLGRRADSIHLSSLTAPTDEHPGYVGALIGRS
ncbi:MAG: AmmeMemoRadiSam system protein B [Rhodothermales bacterium]|nr:AmmeMemoRadiSam system protein B [Rhodothermales bacterium]